MQNNLKKINKKEINTEKINKNCDLENKFSEYEIFLNNIENSTNFSKYELFKINIFNNLNNLYKYFCEVGHLYFIQFFYYFLTFVEIESSLNEKIKNDLFEFYQINISFLLCKFLFLLVNCSFNIFYANNFNYKFIFNLLFLFDTFYVLILYYEYDNIQDNYYYCDYNPQFIALFFYLFGIYSFALFNLIFRNVEKNVFK